MLKLIMKNGMEYLWNSIKICLLLSLKAIIFAKDANMNPFPPTFTPYAILSQSLEKFEMKIVAGTLLMNWERKAESKK